MGAPSSNLHRGPAAGTAPKATARPGRRPWSAPLTLALALAASLWAPAPAEAAPGVSCAFYGLNAGAPVWGGQVILDDAYAQAMAATGARAVRLDFRLDVASSWDAAKLSEYDAIVDAALAAGLEPLGLVAYEATTGGQAEWNDDPDLDGYNPYVGDFAATAAALMAHFQGRVRRWEIWNEPSCWSSPSYASDPQNAGCSYVLPRVFAKIMAEVYLQAEPLIAAGEVSLVSGGIFAHDIGGSMTTGTDYLGEVYAQGVWDWFEANKGRRYPWDELGYHLYVDQGSVEDGAKLAAYLDDVRALAAANNDGAPFAITEIGWTTAAVGADVQAQNLTASYALLASRADVTSTYWFSFRDAPAAGLYFGVAEADGTPKPALAAMQAAAEGCVGAGGAGGGGGGGGAGGGSTSSSSSTSSTSASTSSAGSTSTSGEGGSTTDAPPEDAGGCGCEAAGSERGGAGAIAALALAAGLGLRRRRRRSAVA